MRDPRAHFTEPHRQRLSADDDANAAANRNGTYGPGISLPGARPTRSMDMAGQAAAQSSTLNLDARGCVPTHRSVFRLFRRKVHAQQRSRSNSGHGASVEVDVSNQNTITNASMSTTSTGEHGGYMRSRKNTRGTTLSAQRTRTEYAVAGPPVERELPELHSKGSQSSARPMAQPRLHKADKGTIVQLRSSSSLEKVAIPGVDGLHAAAAAPASDSAPASLANSVVLDETRVVREPPRKSASSIDMTSLLKQLEVEIELHPASDDELLTTTDVAVHVLPDDSSDWNSDFSSPTSWRRSSDRTPSRITPRAIDGSRLKDRAIDRGVLEAQHRILQQERHLMQISNLSSSLAKLRPLILRCLLDLPEQQQQAGTSRAQAYPAQITPSHSTGNTPQRNVSGRAAEAQSASRLYSSVYSGGMVDNDADYEVEYMPSYEDDVNESRHHNPGEIDETNKLVDEDFYNSFGASWATPV
ncbi:hypothetical protein IW145_003981 [Coemansia sp. RSA 521]|nr:hypothetical protein IW145_003981 [Coemansia sp. RSA 521]